MTFGHFPDLPLLVRPSTIRRFVTATESLVNLMGIMLLMTFRGQSFKVDSDANPPPEERLNVTQG